MKTTTRIAMKQYVSHIALINGVADATEKFVAAPEVQQTLVTKLQESSDFLSRINMPLVTEKSAQIIGLSISSTLAGRVNTATTDRPVQDPSALDDRSYDCKQTNFDTALTYAKLDLWAKFPDFQVRIQNEIIKRIALDMIMIGWNGTSAAAATNRGTYPLLQDVNIGWLQKMRTENAARVMTEGAEDDVVTYGTDPTADYANLDALVYDAINTLIPVQHRDNPNLIVITSTGLLHDKYLPIINRDQDSENMVASDIVMSTKRLGGKPAVTVPFFPAGKVLITTYDNLSIYEQEGAHRRTLVDNAKRDQYEDYQSGNYAYVIEDLELACMVENIELLDAA
ncbi:capsid protein [Asticcacaulis sp. AC460]|uniref:phage major capsid protein, P2 family n=1 Tax=Asticcacaulis sp. AC460 TaxID=1282360 RepID=UPI0003C4059F|nr:phage major capsid protein, P2 family [Asticcacaulis sp. AC460]ESQ89992.1 capsid protein [Asticcacaulis sp. AC460]